MSRFRYSQWDGTQEPFGAELSVDRIVDEFTDDMMSGFGSEAALRRMIEGGVPGQFGGLQNLRRRLRELREAQSRRGGLDDVFADVKERLEHIKDVERTELSIDDSEDARFRELTLDALPRSPAGQIRELRDYTFASSAAAEEFAALLDDMRGQMLEQQFRSISEAMGNVTEEDLDRVKDMVADLNRLLEERAAGTGPSQESFDEFMSRHGEFFPENPRTLDELLEVLARRAAAFSRFMASLSPDQQRELMQMSEALMDDLDLRFGLDSLQRSLRSLMPDLGWDQPGRMEGEPMGVGEGIAAMEELSRLEELERMLGQDYPGAGLEDIDRDMLAATLGEDAGRDLDALRKIERALQEAGVATRSEGRLELTPRGVRKMGERALSQVFDRLAVGQPGSHDIAAAGGDGELIGSTRPWRFGDAFRLDLRQTVHNAILREASTEPDTGGAAGSRAAAVRLSPEDFEIAEAERRTAVSTVLLLDMSQSMPLRGHWIHAKRMALALHSLISMQYPEDRLSIIGFSGYARVMEPTDLVAVDWAPEQGTNMEHAFNLAGRILAKDRDATKQVLLVTDGEPTAHLQGDRVMFQWPPAYETLERTYKEAMRLARSGVGLNIFMLEREPSLIRFVDELARIANGRVFSLASDEELGEMIVRDYMRGR